MANILKDIALFSHLGTARVFLAAGMPRSGSTLLYNIVRLCLEQMYGEELLSGWISDIRKAPMRPVCLIKAHNVGLLNLRAKELFYSYRDIRDALVSAQRKFGTDPSLELCRSWIKEDQMARKYASAVFRYEEFTVDQQGAIERVAEILNTSIDISAVLEAIPGAGKDGVVSNGYDKETLLHGSHGTNTGQGDWRTEIDKKLVDDINTEFFWWFEKYQYDLA